MLIRTQTMDGVFNQSKEANNIQVVEQWNRHHQSNRQKYRPSNSIMGSVDLKREKKTISLEWIIAVGASMLLFGIKRRD